MTRVRLPNRRVGLTIDVPHPGTELHARPTVYSVKVGFDENEPRELFIGCNKLTTAMHHAGLEIATLVSIALQHGASLHELASSMPREGNGSPQGAAGAVLDAVIAELGLRSVR